VIYLIKSVIQTVLCRRAAWRVSERRCKEAGVFSFGGLCPYYCGRTEESHEQVVVGKRTEFEPGISVRDVNENSSQRTSSDSVDLRNAFLCLRTEINFF
jgi:hypothetical protein